MSSTSLSVVESSGGKSLKDLFWAHLASYLEWLHRTPPDKRDGPIPNDELTKQIMGYGRQGVIERIGLCSALHDLNPNINPYYREYQTDDMTRFVDYCMTILQRRESYDQKIAGTASNRIGHGYRSQLIEYTRSPDIERLSDCEATEQIFKYCGWIPEGDPTPTPTSELNSDEQQEDERSSSCLGFSGPFVDMRFDLPERPPSPSAAPRSSEHESEIFNPYGLQVDTINIKCPLDMTISETHSCILRPGASLWYRPISEKAIPHILSELEQSPTLPACEIGRSGEGCDEVVDHVRHEVFLAVRRTGQSLSEGRISLEDTPRPLHLEPIRLGSAIGNPYEIAEIPGMSFDIRIDHGDPVRVNLSWLNVRLREEVQHSSDVQDTIDGFRYPWSLINTNRCESKMAEASG
ncbi:hypothetical protein I302_103759 [Kwoniella bestiolae CBS 10118]|uniref:Uncharacterized protein n=1 Tax=Kwoniella bestiolae CBS 10118 TaxID=1296100 RepID=A0A1B9G9G6_9TREE|nr:hypothetical protein I302_02463 [Kwoniella bestiolae CBS 10118]OCF27620.1 hypothetical protein I302_02463 [Kwoniella bestiolae CBS 10118]